MTFKELYCVNCSEPLGDYNEDYFPDFALYDVVKSIQQSRPHKKHDIVILAEPTFPLLHVLNKKIKYFSLRALFF